VEEEEEEEEEAARRSPRPTPPEQAHSTVGALFPARQGLGRVRVKPPPIPLRQLFDRLQGKV